MEGDLAEQLKAIVGALAQAVNHRSCDLEAPPWTYLSADFRAEIEQWSTSKTTVTLDKATYLANFPGSSADNSECMLYPRNMDVDVNYKLGRATVFTNMEVGGLPPNVRKMAVAIFEFQLEPDEVWRCVRSKVQSGIDAAPM